MRKDIKIVFMGTPEFAKCSLKELVESGYDVAGCFTNPDKPSGRGMKMQMSAVKEYALTQNIPVFQPIKVRKNEEVINILNELKPDILVVVAYGKILPKEVLEFPKLGAVNVHGSLLPKYRGAAPIQWSIINGEAVTGITTMFMDEGMDTGDMLLKADIKIEETDNFESVHDKLKDIGSKLLIDTLDKIVDGSIVRINQPEECTYAPMIERDMTKIDFNKNYQEIFNFVRGLSPFPGTYMELTDGRKYKVFKVEGIEDKSIQNIENGTITEVSKDSLCIKCRDGYIKVFEIQPPNSKRMDISAFLQGNKLEINEKFI